MKNPIVLFGAAELGEVAHYYFTHDSEYSVVAFTLDGKYIKESSQCGVPVVPFEEVPQRFPNDSNALFVALSYSKMNTIRKEKYLAAKALGYTLPSYVSSKATTLNAGRIGDNCFILEDNTLQPFARIGNNVTLWSGNHIGHHSVIGDHSFLASHIVVSGGVVIGEQCFVGVNATLRDHITIGDRCVLGAGTLIMADTEPEGVYIGIATERSGVSSGKLRKI